MDFCEYGATGKPIMDCDRYKALQAENERLSQELNGANEACGGLQAIRERLEAEVEELKQSCKAHQEYARQRLDRIHKLEAENERLEKLLREIRKEPLAAMKIRQALNKP